jgi:hypothetical protein
MEYVNRYSITLQWKMLKVIFSRVKDICVTCCLKILFFGTSVLIRITDGTWVLEKNGHGTFVYFSVQ